MPSPEQVEALLADEPDDVFLNYALGKAYVEAGRIECGLAQFRRTLELDPDHVAGYFQMAQVLASTGDDEAARETVTRGIAVAKKVGDAHAEMEMTGFLDAL
ncbi:MAG: tetratricopeptide repeat protein [Planctomycetaceae bacterium]